MDRILVPQVMRPPVEERLNANLLATLKCPFFKQCEFQECPFAHESPPSREEVRFNNDSHPIPWYFCMDHLLYECQSARYQQSGSRLVRCQFGFHPGNEDLEDADLFKSRMAFALLSGELFPRQAQTQTFSHCAICNTRMTRNCTILENCSHRFCTVCSSREFHAFTVLLNRDIICGFCNVTSKRIMYWTATAISNSYRRVIFSLQRRAFGLMIGSGSQVVVSDQLLTDGKVLIQYRQFDGRMTKMYCIESREEPQESPTSPLVSTTSSDQCYICLENIAASPERLWAYLENCSHRFCLRCLLEWRARRAPVELFTSFQSIAFSCPTCRAKAGRILAWPAALNNPNLRQFLFDVQKLFCGLRVSSQTSISVHEVSHTLEDLAFICNNIAWIPARCIVIGPNGQPRLITED